MKKTLIKIENGIARMEQYRLKEPINLEINSGEQLAIIGDNASGKTLLVETLIGRYPLYKDSVSYDFSPSASDKAYDNIKYMAFKDSYGEADGNYYYQQRWNSQDLEESPIVGDLLPKTDNFALKDTLYTLFNLKKLLDKHVVLLSSGELRKFQLAKTLLTNPRVLIMDNPFIGLDVQTRGTLYALLKELIEVTNMQIVLVLSQNEDLPDFITHIIHVKDKVCGKKTSREEYLNTISEPRTSILSKENENKILNLDYKENLSKSDLVIEMNNVAIRYGERTILKELNLEIKKGEKWALSGENGTGKSTLLSLICADNPQSYACNINLFGRKRGTGESIWDIKKRIGYVSPEMHRSYSTALPCIEIVASGLHDTIGLYKRANDEELAVCEWWMEIFGILELKNKNFMQISSGEQRLVLLARAFVKDPELLILDEPMHGLDEKNCRLVKDIIEAFSHRNDKTLIIVSHYDNKLPNCITNSLFLKRN